MCLLYLLFLLRFVFYFFVCHRLNVCKKSMTMECVYSSFEDHTSFIKWDESREFFLCEIRKKVRHFTSACRMKLGSLVRNVFSFTTKVSNQSWNYFLLPYALTDKLSQVRTDDRGDRAQPEAGFCRFNGHKCILIFFLTFA